MMKEGGEGQLKQRGMNPIKVYPVVLREIANLIEAKRIREVNVEALEKIIEFIRKKPGGFC